MVKRIWDHLKKYFQDDKKYWQNRVADWEKAYGATINHSHRDSLMGVLRSIEFDSVLEIGCNCAPNLQRIKKEFKGVKLAGVDINEQSIVSAINTLPEATLRVSEASELPVEDKSYDLVITDAILIYIDRKEIKKVRDEMLRVARKAIVMVEWQADREDKLFGHWRRDYRKLFEGHKIHLNKITNWGGGWNRFGYIIYVEIKS